MKWFWVAFLFQQIDFSLEIRSQKRHTTSEFDAKCRISRSKIIGGVLKLKCVDIITSNPIYLAILLDFM